MALAQPGPGPRRQKGGIIRPDGHGRWTELRSRFEELAELEPASRIATLREIARLDPDLARDLEELLAHCEEAGDSFEEELLSIPSAAAREIWEDEDPDELAAHGQVGPYQALEKLGRGGAGTVYRARRYDGEYEHDVAIKVLRRGLDTADLLVRFRAERQILASLRHPRIARLIDGGSLDDGRPYLVMDYVDGQPIDDYCERQDLTIPARLELFLQVCDAVAHAHRNLVLHRDIKPTNILVSPTGSVYLLDFGIAKILDPELIPADSPETRAEVRMFTPEFAAPEQVDGESVSVATDVYQLGHLLYRLLTGRSAYDFSQRPTVTELRRRFHQEPPDPPSAAAADRGERWRRMLRGDLDAIVMMALRTEPDRRYPTVETFAADLRRHLEGHPVEARPDGMAYRARKFARRNPWPMALAGFACAAAVAGALGLALHSAQLERERDRARIEAERAEAATDFLLDLFQLAEDTGGRDTMTVGQLLERGRQRVDERVGDHPVIHIALLKALETAHHRVGLDLDAQQITERRLAATRDHHGPAHPETMDALRVLGARYSRARHWPRAIEVLEERVALHEAMPPDRAGSHEARADLANAYRSLSVAYREEGRVDDALDAIERAMEIGATDVEDVEARIRDAGGLAFVLRGLDRFDEAAALYETAIALSREELGEARPVHLNNYASLLRAMGRPEEAEPLLREARDRAWEDRTSAAPSPDLDVLWGNLVSLLLDLEDYDGAIAVAREAVDELRKVLQPDHWRVGRALSRLGNSYRVARRCAAGEPVLREAAETYTAALGADHAWTARVNVQLAHCLIEMGRHSEAERVLSDARPFIRGPHAERLQMEARALLYEETAPARAAELRARLEAVEEEG